VACFVANSREHIFKKSTSVVKQGIFKELGDTDNGKGTRLDVKFPVCGALGSFRGKEMLELRTQVFHRACPLRACPVPRACRFIAARDFPFEETAKNTIS